MDTHSDNIQEELTKTKLVKLAFGEVVASHRDRAGMAQRGLSSVAGISNSHLRGIEAGDVSPTLVTICKIAETLDEPPAVLVEEAWEKILAGLPQVSVDYQKRS